LKKTIVLLFILLFVHCFCQAQEPSHYFLLETEFSGIDIYDAIQDDDGQFLFATDQGVFLYDGYTVEKVECPEMIGMSMFSFRKDSHGRIYCHNLNNQVFYIENRTMRLFYLVPESDRYHEMWIDLNSKDQVYVQTTELKLLDRTGEKVYDSPMKSDAIRPNSFHILSDETCVAIMNDLLIVAQNGQSGYHPVIAKNQPDGIEFLATTWLTVGGESYVIDQNTMGLYLYEPATNSFLFLKFLLPELKGTKIRTYVTGNKIWMAGNQKGIYLLDQEFNLLSNNGPLFRQHLISNVFLDDEGNLLLSTFGHGIILVPDLASNSIRIHGDEYITSMASDGEQSLFIGNDRGEIYHYHAGTKQTTKIYTNPSANPIDHLAFWKEHSLLLHTGDNGFQYSVWNGESLARNGGGGSALKGAYFAKGEPALLAVNKGMYALSTDEKHVVSRFNTPINRTYCIAKDEYTGTIYVGTNNGFQIMYADGTIEPYLLKGKPIYASEFHVSGDLVYVGTYTHGVLLFQNDQLIKRLPLEESVRKIITYKDQLFVLTTERLYSSRLENIQLMSINQLARSKGNETTDFLVLGEEFYFANQQSIESIHYDELKPKADTIPIRKLELLVDDSVSSAYTFDHTSRKYVFQFYVSTIKHREGLLYQCKLVGYDEGWIELPYGQNSIAYNGLGPGTYQFVVRTKSGEQVSQTMDYSIKIVPPIYQRGWFYLLIAVLLVAVVSVIYAMRIRSIRKKNELRLKEQKIQSDLLESQLKALRSQMNPHFIFNCLNSIQDLILNERTEASYDYIVLFASLVRNALNYSNQDFITIEKEVEFLDVYLQLEQLRFKDDFEFTIEADRNSEIKVPSLLIQPFIENALVHGLLHKDGKKTLSVRFEHNTKLMCIIEDNGIGMEKSKAINTRQSGNHQSFAMQAIEKRLEILSSQGYEDVGYEVEDLFEEGLPSGTRVSIHVPYREMY